MNSAISSARLYVYSLALETEHISFPALQHQTQHLYMYCLSKQIIVTLSYFILPLGVNP